MKKLYKIDNRELGIDFDKVIAFYIDGAIDTYHGKYEKYLNILMGNKFSEPEKIRYVYYNAYAENWMHDENARKRWNNNIDINVHELYQDLIEYFKNE